MSERTVTTRDGFVSEFNAQSDAEAKAYKAGWADCLSELGDENAVLTARIRAALAALLRRTSRMDDVWTAGDVEALVNVTVHELRALLDAQTEGERDR